MPDVRLDKFSTKIRDATGFSFDESHLASRAGGFQFEELSPRESRIQFLLKTAPRRRFAATSPAAPYHRKPNYVNFVREKKNF